MKKKKIEPKKKERDQLKEQLARALADYDNLRKRVEKGKESFEKNASLKIVLKMLPILDMLEQIQEHLKDPGLAIAINEYKDVLYSEGLEEIKSESGADFDENLQEVVETIKGGRKGEISEEVLVGWKYRDTIDIVVRPEKVKVFSGSK